MHKVSRWFQTNSPRWKCFQFASQCSFEDERGARSSVSPTASIWRHLDAVTQFHRPVGGYWPSQASRKVMVSFHPVPRFRSTLRIINGLLALIKAHCGWDGPSVVSVQRIRAPSAVCPRADEARPDSSRTRWCQNGLCLTQPREIASDCFRPIEVEGRGDQTSRKS